MKTRTTRFVITLAVTLLALSACSIGRQAAGGAQDNGAVNNSGGGGSIPEEGNPLPTARPTEVIGAEAQSRAQDSPEATWEGYLRDIIAYQNERNDAKITLVRRYQNPDQTSQNVGGTVEEITLLEDRSTFDKNAAATAASSLVDFDVRVQYLDGDTQTKTCTFTVEMQYSEADGVWYVINPRGLDTDVNCA